MLVLRQPSQTRVCRSEGGGGAREEAPREGRLRRRRADGAEVRRRPDYAEGERTEPKSDDGRTTPKASGRSRSPTSGRTTPEASGRSRCPTSSRTTPEASGRPATDFDRAESRPQMARWRDRPPTHSRTTQRCRGGDNQPRARRECFAHTPPRSVIWKTRSRATASRRRCSELRPARSACATFKAGLRRSYPDPLTSNRVPPATWAHHRSCAIGALRATQRRQYFCGGR